MLRFVVIAVVIAGVAVAAPRYAPALLDSLLNGADRPATTPPSAASPPTAAPPPTAEVEDLPPPPPVERIQVLDGRRVTIMADSSGHFLVEARIKGRIVSVMVDTGATTVALSEATARRLGIFPARAAFNRQVATANGIVEAASVTLPDVRVGGIVVRNVEALVIPGESLGIDLLGMSFLGRLRKFESSDGRLILVQ